MTVNTILVITGSTRPLRIGDQLSAEIARLAGATTPAVVRVESLADRSLPFLDEPQPAAMGGYTQEHSQRWSAVVAEADAVVFVTPEYNAGYPAGLKNAIDYLYSEWRNKPAVVVSYGSRGGYRVQKQLNEVASSLQMRVTAGVEVSINRADYDADGRLADPQSTMAPYRESLVAAFSHLLQLTSVPAEERVEDLPAAA